MGNVSKPVVNHRRYNIIIIIRRDRITYYGSCLYDVLLSTIAHLYNTAVVIIILLYCTRYIIP